MRIPATILCLSVGTLLGQDIAPKDSERDPVLTDLLEDNDFIEVTDVDTDPNEEKDDGPVLLPKRRHFT